MKILKWLLGLGFAALTAMVLVLAGAYLYLAPDLPSTESLRQVQLQVPLKVYSRDGQLMAEFGDKRRTPIEYEHIPDTVIQAFLAAEDDRFFSHPGVDYQGLIRAAINLIRTGEKGQGGSTITMQVARNFFLSSEKTYIRKLNEIFLALKIERELSKEEIFELYLNKIYFGNRAYGIQAAAQVYYGKPVTELDLAQIAMIAGLPKAPSRFNPIADPERALQRRNYVLRRMNEVGFIDQQVMEQAKATPMSAKLHAQNSAVEAPYVAEMVRQYMVERFGPQAYTDGYQVYTTVDPAHQASANRALRKALLAYSRRHGYHGAEEHLPFESLQPQDWATLIDDRPVVGGLFPGLVIALEEQTAKIFIGDDQVVTLDWEAMNWAREYKGPNARGPAPKRAEDILKVGDLIRLESMPEGKWQLAQVPKVGGALVALAPDDGAIVALVGGFDYFQSKFNRAVQAKRQPGSNFKPFIYSAALEQDFTPASLINDAPVVFDDPALEATWRPENYSGKFYGPTRLREALVHSRNLVSIRLLRSIGIDYGIEYAARFGFPRSALPRDLSLALGSGTLSPLEMARGFAVFANGGFLVQPYFITRVEREGRPILRSQPIRACRQCEQDLTPVERIELPDSLLQEVVQGQASGGPQDEQETTIPAAPSTVVETIEQTPIAPRVITPQNEFIMVSMMKDVIRRGTARRALQLGRNDLAGKTGTTNDQRDAWFSGFNPDLVATAWVGFDQVAPLGNRETGGHAALPMWMDFMAAALAGVAEKDYAEPAGLVSVRIDPKTGLLADGDSPDAIFEIFPAERAPTEYAQRNPPGTTVHHDGTIIPRSNEFLF